MFCALLTSRYQVSVYRTNGPLVVLQVIFTSIAIATTLFVCLQLDKKNPLIFYAIFGLAAAVIVLPSLVFIIKWDGIKHLIGVVFKNKKSVSIIQKKR